MAFSIIPKKPNNIDIVRGKIIKKSLELYFASKEPKIRYNKKGKIIRKLYNITNFCKEFGVDNDTITRWYKTGRITKWSKVKLIMMGILPERMW